MADLLTMAALSVLLVSFGVGIVVGLTGMGGGALMTPALIFLGCPRLLLWPMTWLPQASTSQWVLPCTGGVGRPISN